MTMMNFKPDGDDLPAFCTLHFTVSQTQLGHKCAFTQRIDCAEASEGLRLMRASRKDWHPHVHLDWQKKGQILELREESEPEHVYYEKFFYDFDGVTWLPFSVTMVSFRGSPVFDKTETRFEVGYQEPTIWVECMARDDRVYMEPRPGCFLHVPPIYCITCYRDLDMIDRLLEGQPKTSAEAFALIKG